MNYRINKVITFLLLLTVLLRAQVVHQLKVDRTTHYQFNDWVSYATALTITSVDIGPNYIFFGTKSGGILRYDKYEDKWDYPFTTSNGLRSNTIFKIVYNPDDGFLYARTPAGIDVYKPAEGFWRVASLVTMPLSKRADSIKINNDKQKKKDDFRFPLYFRPSNSMLPDFFTDRFWVYHFDGTLFDRYNREFKLTDRIVDSWNRLWTGTNGAGPMRGELDIIRLESMPYSIPDISPRDCFLDENDIWVGGIRNSTGVAGISRWNRKSKSWQYYEAAFISHLYKDDVVALCGNSHAVIFATNLGCSVYDKKKNKWKTYDTRDGLNGDSVRDVLVAGDTAFIAAEYGLNWLDLKTMELSEPSQLELDNVQINQLTHDGQLLWAATRFGLYSIDPVEDQIVFHSSRAALPDYNLTAVEFIDQKIWFAGSSGIAFWDRETNEWHSFPDLQIQANIRDISATKNAIWFSTDRGVLKYNTKKDYWRLFTTQDGLISNDVYHIDPDGRHLWISTADGITQFRWRRKGRID